MKLMKYTLTMTLFYMNDNLSDIRLEAFPLSFKGMHYLKIVKV